jgi:hypothetical protein
MNLASVTSKLSALCSMLVLAMIVIAVPADAQNPATYGNAAGRYGLTAWAINNQRVASQFNYDIDSIFGGNSVASGAFTFPISTCTQALPLGGNKNVNPFNTNASVKIVDVSSSLTETVNGVTPTYSGGLCTLSFTATNTHTSFHLRSGTCGLREALNDLGANGGVIIVDQKFYDDGCTQSTITGLNALVSSTSGPIYQNQYVHDVSNGQDMWYALRPTATTLISAGAAPTTGTVAGGTFTNGNVIVSYTYVDALGRESLPSSETTQASGGTTNGITVTSPAVATGAVGYRPYFTAVGGSTLTEIAAGAGAAGDPTAAGCTLTTLETMRPACAIGSTFTALAPVTSTSKEPTIGYATTTMTFQPVSGLVPMSPTSQTLGTFIPTQFANAAQGTINNSNEDLAVIQIPAGYFNTIGKSYQVCYKTATATQVASSVIAMKLNLSTAYNQSPVTLSTATYGTYTQAAAGTQTGCWIITTAATGASGTFWAQGTGLFLNILNSAPTTTTGATADVTTAVSSTVDLTKNVYLALNMTGTGSANITGPQALVFTITPLGN